MSALFEFTYNGAMTSKVSMVEVEATESVIIVAVYGSTAVNSSDAISSVVGRHGATSIVVEVANSRHVCTHPYVPPHGMKL